MNLRVLVVRSVQHGVVTNVEATKDDLMRYLSDMLKLDMDNRNGDTYPKKDAGKQVSLIPVLMSPEAWEYMKTQITMSADLNDIYAIRIQAILDKQKDTIFNISKSGTIKTMVVMFVFNNEYELKEKELSSKVLNSMEELLDQNTDKHDIEEISFGVVEEMVEDLENIVYN